MMRLTGIRLSTAAAALAAVSLCGVSRAQVLTQLDKVTASDAAAGFQLGSSIDVDGDTVIVGAPKATNASAVDTGAAYVYVRAGDVWNEEQKLTSPDALSGDLFGGSVAIDGDTAVVGARFYDEAGFFLSGAAFVFVRSGTTWTQQQKIVPTDPADFDWFGQSVDIDGETIVIGSNFNDGAGMDAGAAYVFVRSGTTWSEQQKLFANDAFDGDFFGWSVAISGETIVVGSEFDDDSGADSGSAYFFTRSGTVWTQQDKVTASDGAADDQFGVAVALSGDTAVVGAIMSPFMAPCCNGAAYVYVRAGASWLEQQKLTASDGAIDDFFGGSVSIDGDAIAVGAFKSDVAGMDSGQGYVFERSGTVWSQTTRLIGTDTTTGDWLGDSISISGTVIAVGASKDNPTGDGSGDAARGHGAGYVFDTAGGPGSPFCFGTGCPCGNDAAASGCVNSAGHGASLTGSGSTSVAADDLVLTATGCPPLNSGLFFVGGVILSPVFVGDGLACTGGLFRYFPGIVDGAGTFVQTGLVAGAPVGTIPAGSTRHFQAWTRDVLCGPPPAPCPTPCGMNSNLSNGYSVTFTP